MSRILAQTEARRRTDWKMLARQLALLGGAALAAGFIYLRKQPERLPVSQKIYPFHIHQGRGYWITPVQSAIPGVFDPAPSIIHTVSLSDGKEWDIFSEPINRVIASSYDPALLTFTPTHLLYRTVARPKPVLVSSGSFGVGGSASRTTEEGDFRASHAPLQAGEKRQKLPSYSLPRPEIQQWRRLPLSGGAAQDMAAIASPSQQAAGDYIYWIRLRPDEVVSITRGKFHRTETTGHSDLMMTPLAGGAARLVRSGVSQSLNVAASHDGVSWMEPHAYPDHHADLYYCRAGETTPRRLAADIPTGPYGRGIGKLTEYKNRLYWFLPDMNATDLHAPIKTTGTLVSANLDGSDRRDVLPVRGRWEAIELLGEDGGQLYCLLTEPGKPSASFTPPTTLPPRYLCRLHPERSDPLEILQRLPDNWRGVQLDSGYFYFYLEEKHRSWLDWAMNDETNVETKSTLCRIRLP